MVNQPTFLEKYQHYLQSRRIVPAHKVPFYVHWVSLTIFDHPSVWVPSPTMTLNAFEGDRKNQGNAAGQTSTGCYLLVHVIHEASSKSPKKSYHKL